MTEAERKLRAIRECAPWLAADGKALHMPVQGMGKDHQVTWPEMFALIDEADRLRRTAGEV